MSLIQPRILIAEDEEVLRDLLVKYFRRENYLIEEVDNGVDAVEKAMINEYDLIILDILMPKMDGLDALQEIRKTRETPVVILSVKGGISEKREAIKMGATDYILKPFSPSEFVKTIKVILSSGMT
ncbi:response regulator transcription factor [Pseudoneobacillus sp. C159]